jgi:hypothetical protein
MYRLTYTGTSGLLTETRAQALVQRLRYKAYMRDVTIMCSSTRGQDHKRSSASYAVQASIYKRDAYTRGYSIDVQGYRVTISGRP